MDDPICLPKPLSIATREEPDKQMTLVFDCAGSGVKNIDLDNMQFMINSFKEDYPWCLNYILVYEMPWVMNGTRVDESSAESADHICPLSCGECGDP